MLWLCLYFPRLALDVFAPAEDVNRPCVVYQKYGSQSIVITGNKRAESLGIVANIKMNAAYALSNELLAFERDKLSEQQTLESLACWAMQFSSEISINRENGLLIEIGGSLNLFGGIDKLTEIICEQLREQSDEFRYAVAPTPAAAELLAKADVHSPIMRQDDLPNLLGNLPASFLAVEPAILETLSGLGIRFIRDVLRLPRGALARRLGQEFNHSLEQLLGTRPDLRPRFNPPDFFQHSIELPYTAENNEPLIFAGKRLTDQLSRFLMARGSATQQLLWTLTQTEQRTQTFTIGLSAPSRNAQHFHSLLKERLTHMPLNAPVTHICLRVDHLQSLAQTQPSLFEQHATRNHDNWQILVERLSARLGPNAVSSLQEIDDHRPERAYRYVRPGDHETSQTTEHANKDKPKLIRPAWLLANPTPLTIRESRPYYYGPLRFLAGPERIESGWWDSNDTQRDYYTAENPKGIRVWIFKSIDEKGGWFLHGIF